MEATGQVSRKGYARWEGRRATRKLPWWPITRTGIKLAFSKKRFKAFFAFAFLPAVFTLGGIYISERLEDFRTYLRGADRFLEVNPGYFMQYFTNGSLFLFIIVIMALAGSGLVADDLKNNALQLYFARPIRKRDYLLGKMSVLVFFITLLTFLPGLVFLIFKLIFSGSFKFLSDYPWLPLGVAAESVLLVAFFSVYTLALSALSKNSRYVMVLIAAIYYFSEVLFGILYGIFRSPYTTLVSFKRNINQVSAVIFGQKPPYAVPPLVSFVLLFLLVGAGVYVLVRRIRSVEVIR